MLFDSSVFVNNQLSAIIFVPRCVTDGESVAAPPVNSKEEPFVLLYSPAICATGDALYFFFKLSSAASSETYSTAIAPFDSNTARRFAENLTIFRQALSEAPRSAFSDCDNPTDTAHRPTFRYLRQGQSHSSFCFPPM